MKNPNHQKDSKNFRPPFTNEKTLHRHSNSISIEMVRISTLQPSKRQMRIHTDHQIAKIAASIEAFGFVEPILIDNQGHIICGLGRVKAAEVTSMTHVPAVRISHLSEDQKRAYAITANRLAELSDWDNEMLAIEFQHFLEVDLDFDVAVIGFETPEIDLIIGEAANDVQTEEENALPALDRPATISQVGDLWKLGPHLLYCGNALETSSYDALLTGTKADMVFTDPPYNVKIAGNVCGKGQIQHREFIMASGEMSEEEFSQFLLSNLLLLHSVSADGSLLYICMDWRHLETLLSAGRKAGLELVNICIWNKDNGGMGSLYRSKHEEVVVFRKGSRTGTNNVQLGKFGRNRTNVWDYPGVNSMHKGRMNDLAMHPTVKPVGLVADAILDITHRKGVVLDPFCGSGTTIIAAEKTGRLAYCMELDPAYIDVAIRRYQNLYGVDAVLLENGRSFCDVEKGRSENGVLPEVEGGGNE